MVAVGEGVVASEAIAAKDTGPVTLEQLWNLAQQMEKRENTGKNPDLEARYPFMFRGETEQVKYDVQFVRGNEGVKKDTIQVVSNGQTTEVEIAARVWMTGKGYKDGKGNTLCYMLGTDGQWFLKTASTYEYDREKNTTIWDMGDPTRVDVNQQQVMLNKMLSQVKVAK
jgi:hypothetical protein